MIPQNPVAEVVDGRLALSWYLWGEYKGVSIEVFEAIDRSVGLRTFVLPPSSGCQLDVGAGAWYYRVGALVGTDDGGSVEWSGTYGPVAIAGAKEKLPQRQSPLKITSLQPILEGVRFSTGLREPYWVWIDYWNKELTMERTIYLREGGQGFFNLIHLHQDHTYTITITTALEGWDTLIGNTVKQLGTPLVLKDQRASRPMVLKTNTDKATFESNKLLLREAAAKPNRRYDSYVDYVKMIALQAATTEPKRLV